MKKANCITLTLPLPPSVNAAYCNVAGVGRVKTKKYKEWEKEAYEACLTQPKYELEGNEWLEADYTYYMPIWCKNGNIKRIDTSNREKCTSDFIEKIIPGFKDEKIKRIIMEKKDSELNEVEIKIYEI